MKSNIENKYINFLRTFHKAIDYAKLLQEELKRSVDDLMAYNNEVSKYFDERRKNENT